MIGITTGLDKILAEIWKMLRNSNVDWATGVLTKEKIQQELETKQ